MAREYGQWPLNVCQMGQETTGGTAVAATTVWRGPFGGYEDNRATEEVEEDVGTFGTVADEYVVWNNAKAPFPSATMHFEQLPHILQASMGVVSPTGAGPYVRKFSAPFGDTPPTLKSYTLRIGNKRVTADAKQLAFALVDEWELSGKQGELWKLSGGWTAPRAVTTTFTPALALPAVQAAVFANSKLYIDDSGGTFGTNQKTGVLMAAAIKYKTAIEWVPVGDGALYATAYKLGRPEVTFTLTLELEQDGANSVVAQETTKYEAQALRLIRLEVVGASPRKLWIDLVGQYSKRGPYQKEGDANTTVTFEGRAKYSSADAEFFSIEHTSSLATIP